MRLASRLYGAIALATLITATAPMSAEIKSDQKKDAGKASPYDPRAVTLLQDMADAYTHLSAFRQETEFTSIVKPLVPLPAIRPEPRQAGTPDTQSPDEAPVKRPLESERLLDKKLHLSFAAPNRLRLEIEDLDDNGKIQVSRWVCDGKSFWTFKPDKNLFSREKAPPKIKDFAKLAHMTSGSLEVLMLMGINPFDHVEEQAESVRCTGRETVQGIDTEVVSMTADLGPQSTETRFYIGAEDRLLHRLVSETTQKALPPKRAGVGSPLDELAPRDYAPPPTVNADGTPALIGVLMKSSVICDNKIDTEPHFEYGTFTYTPPADAYYLTNPDPHKPPPTLKQRIAELNRAARRKKKAPPKVYRY